MGKLTLGAESILTKVRSYPKTIRLRSISQRVIWSIHFLSTLVLHLFHVYKRVTQFLPDRKLPMQADLFPCRCMHLYPVP